MSESQVTTKSAATKRLLTYKELRYIAERLKGTEMGVAATRAGLPAWMASHPTRLIENGLVKETLDELQSRLVEFSIEESLVDAAELHRYLSDAIRADMRDIRNSDGTFKPQEDWPPIWGQMMEAGDVEVEYVNERSHDGKTENKKGGWDENPTRQVAKIKLKFSSRTKLMELAMRHKGINAFVEQKQGDVNIVVVTAERARQVDAAMKRLAKVVPAEAVSIPDTPYIEDATSSSVDATGSSDVEKPAEPEAQ